MRHEKTQTLQRKDYYGVMISSTFSDLMKHRAVLIEALNSASLHAVSMESSAAQDVDIITSSLQMVADSVAYIGIVGHKLGQIPVDPDRNPEGLSITELEYDEATRLGLSTLVFIMGDEHPVVARDVEQDPTRKAILDAFRTKIKVIPGTKLNRIYARFNSIEEFSVEVHKAVPGLRAQLEESLSVANTDYTRAKTAVSCPLFAEPPYIGSHPFVGRKAQLETLNFWASPSELHPLMLFDAIGGSGKSILTWEWLTVHSTSVRSDWAGRLWYSFYERGATMADFCRTSLAYMSSRPKSDFKDRNTSELLVDLRKQLRSAPWLIVLDGLERILVSYHRFDPSQMLDENAGGADSIAQRDPCSAISPEDDELLRELTASTPSKVLVTTRLVPRSLLNNSAQPIPGVLREHLPGLRPTDAELLLRSCGVVGTPALMQDFLVRNCDCHPLLVGVIAGLVMDFLPDRGNFDLWQNHTQGGSKLNLGNLDLIQRRNHILAVALQELDNKSRQLLSTLSLLSGSVDYNTLCALNPVLPAIPENTPIPPDPARSKNWHQLDPAHRKKVSEEYEVQLRNYNRTQDDLSGRSDLIEKLAPQLVPIIHNLEKRGLVQYDHHTRRYDLHPVVRAIVVNRMQAEERGRYGKLVVDHFSQKAEDPFSQEDSEEAFYNAKTITLTLLQLGKFDDARKFIQRSNFLQKLNHRHEAHHEILTILRPFFVSGWRHIPPSLEKKGTFSFAKIATTSLKRIDALAEALEVATAILDHLLRQELPQNLLLALLNLAGVQGERNALADEDEILSIIQDFEALLSTQDEKNSFYLARFRQLSRLAKWEDAAKCWDKIGMLTEQARQISSHHLAVSRFLQGSLTADEIDNAQRLAEESEGALGVRNLHILRGSWELDRENYSGAIGPLKMAIELARKAGKIDKRSEIKLDIAMLMANSQNGELIDIKSYQYSVTEVCYLEFAQLLAKMGELRLATKYGRLARDWALADGLPFSRIFELHKAEELLRSLDAHCEPARLFSSTSRTSSQQLEVVRQKLDSIGHARMDDV